MFYTNVRSPVKSFRARFCMMRSTWSWPHFVFLHLKITARDPGATIAFYKTVLESGGGGALPCH